MEFSVHTGLMAYTVDLAELLRRMANDVHQILTGADVGKKGKCIRTAVYGYAWIAAISPHPGVRGQHHDSANEPA